MGLVKANPKTNSDKGSEEIDYFLTEELQGVWIQGEENCCPFCYLSQERGVIAMFFPLNLGIGKIYV